MFSNKTSEDFWEECVELFTLLFLVGSRHMLSKHSGVVTMIVTVDGNQDNHSLHTTQFWSIYSHSIASRLVIQLGFVLLFQTKRDTF